MGSTAPLSPLPFPTRAVFLLLLPLSSESSEDRKKGAPTGAHGLGRLLRGRRTAGGDRLSQEAARRRSLLLLLLLRRYSPARILQCLLQGKDGEDGSGSRLLVAHLRLCSPFGSSQCLEAGDYGGSDKAVSELVDLLNGVVESPPTVSEEALSEIHGFLASPLADPVGHSSSSFL